MELKELDNRKNVGRYLDANGLNGSAVEVGVAFGQNAKDILNSGLKNLFLVDPYRSLEYQDGVGFANAIKDWEGCKNYMLNLLSPEWDRCFLLEESSLEAASKFSDGVFDFVYIDANHLSPYVDQDLRAWWPKVRSGGLFGGHDYVMIDRPDYKCTVKKAVDDFCAEYGLEIHVTDSDEHDFSWWIVKQ